MAAEIMSDAWARLTSRDYVCARCWGHLLRRALPDGQSSVECARDPEHSGFSSKHWVDRQRQADIGNSMDAKYLLRRIGVIHDPHAGKTEEDLLKGLGV